MRVLMINDHGRAYGGAELQMLGIRDGLAQRGHECRLFSSNAEMVPGYPLLAERHCHGRSDLAQVALQTANPTAWWALYNEIRDYPPDIVHIRSFLWQLSPLVLPLLRQIPVLHQPPAYKEICPNGLKMLPDGSNCTHRVGAICHKTGCVSWRTYRMARLQLSLLERWRGVLDVTAVLSHRAATVFRDAGWKDVEVLHNPISLRQPAAPQADAPTVVYVGRLAREKGVGLLIEAFAALRKFIPAARLIIAGTGPLEAALKAQATGLGSDICFLGHVPFDELDDALVGAWVQAVPSLWQEPFGNVTLEAMSRGTAVLGSDAGAIPELMVQGETGLVVPPGDVAAWTASLRELLSDKQTCIRMGQAGRRRVEAEYSRERHMDRIISLYELAQRRCFMGGTARMKMQRVEGK